jgi:peptide-methionine (S)-S-oxide reductase
MESIILGGGCFWCLDALYPSINGVVSSTCGYAGGKSTNPTYQAVSSGTTGHTEVVRVQFDPQKISLKTILEVFWSIHDPTTPNQQGADIGTQYRSAIYYDSEDQLNVITSVQADMQQYWADPIVTEIAPLEHFYEAEDYHQNYFLQNPEAAYCQLVINPKLAGFKQKFARLLA